MDHGEILCHKLAMADLGEDPTEHRRWLHVLPKPDFTLNPDLLPPLKIQVNDKRTPWIDVFYVQPGDEYTRDDELLDKVNKGLKLNHKTAKSTFEKEDLDKNDDPDRVGLKLKIATSELIFAIVDNRGYSKNDIQKFVAKLHKFAAFEAGIPLVCVTWKTLDELYTRRLVTGKSYLPATLQVKINYMLGGHNFDTVFKRVTTGNEIMIARAHIAHHNGDKLYGPSITAVVASKDDTSSHFLDLRASKKPPSAF